LIEQRGVASSELAGLIRDLHAAGASARLRVSGGSMSPTIRDGDVVLIDPVTPAELRRGLIVAASIDGRLTIHRVIAVRRKGGEIRVRLRGDNRVEADPWVGTAELVGKIDRLERDGRSLPARPTIPTTATLRRWVRRSRLQKAVRRWLRTH
jgi:signal peptidase I